MSEDAPDDLDELRALVADLDASAAALRAYGEANDVPAIERGAKRVQGTLDSVKQNVPGALVRDGAGGDDDADPNGESGEGHEPGR
ncbi:hypothetical protein [Halarchaeum nitratireducens]|uniref:Uncharacterized protein n=1 Tax=Halarchaeum nitratireducens TaxID=489913 RepID=A0A830G8D0_9EURY|nr:MULTISPECIES: hypothetical protein [Halarchaeum]MBP2249797.1 hypothetical protein [Halarchaeum solikamskense]GGN10549.1 hypothetical protein GCM10009021_07960 [Halarchaeum nitratireducens]